MELTIVQEEILRLKDKFARHSVFEDYYYACLGTGLKINDYRLKVSNPWVTGRWASFPVDPVHPVVMRF